MARGEHRQIMHAVWNSGRPNDVSAIRLTLLGVAGVGCINVAEEFLAGVPFGKVMSPKNSK